MITGQQIRSARERAGLTQEELANRLGVSMRSVGNWERGATVPRSKSAAVEAILGDHLEGPASATPPLAEASDVELLAEIAKRFTRVQERANGGHHDEANHHDEKTPKAIADVIRLDERNGSVEHGHLAAFTPSDEDLI